MCMSAHATHNVVVTYDHGLPTEHNILLLRCFKGLSMRLCIHHSRGPCSCWEHLQAWDA